MQTIQKPLDEASFSEYLKILRENDYSDDAMVSEEFYISLLVGVDLGGGKMLTKEQVYATPFKKLVEAAEILLMEMSRQITKAASSPSIPGKMLGGKDADKLPPEELDYLMRRQLQLMTEEKLRLG